MSNLMVLAIAVITTGGINRFVLNKNYSSLKNSSFNDSQVSSNISRNSFFLILLLGLVWIVVFAIATVDHGHWEGFWALFIPVCFIYYGFMSFKFFWALRKTKDAYKLPLLILALVFTTSIVPIKLVTSTQNLISSLTPEHGIIRAKLLSVSGGEYVSSASYYEGVLNFENEQGTKQYSVLLCQQKWPYLQINSYYNLDLDELSRAKNSHSAETSGCYTKNFIGS